MITQFRLGGMVILPMAVGNMDDAGLLHNRQFAIWPYARIKDPRLRLGDEFILFKEMCPPAAVQVWYFNTRGWMAY